MKKHFLGVLSLSLAAVAALHISASAFNMSMPGGYDVIIAADDFESGTASRALWSYDEGLPPLAVNNGSLAVKIPGEGYRFRLNYTAVDRSYIEGVNPKNAVINKLCQAKLEMDVFFNDTMNAEIQIVEYDCENTLGMGVHPELSLLSFYADGTAEVLGGGKLTYEAWKKYTVTLYLDYYSNTYTAYLNAEQIARDLPIYPNGHGIAPISAGVYVPPADGEGCVFIDNFKYSVPRYSRRDIFYGRVVTGSDFEDGRSVSAVFQTKGNITVEPATIDREKHNNVAVVYNVDTTGATTDSILRPHYSFVNKNAYSEMLSADKAREAQKIIFDIDILLYDIMQMTIHVVGHKDTDNRTLIPLAQFGANGSFTLRNGDSCPYETNKWYSFRFYINFESNTYTTCVNGTMLGEDIPFNTDYLLYGLACGVQIQSLGFETAVEVDNIYYYFVTEGDVGEPVLLWQGEEMASIAYIAAPEDIPGEGASLIGAAYNESGQLTDVDICTKAADAEQTYFLVKLRLYQGTQIYCMLWDTMKPIWNKIKFLEGMRE